MQHAAQKRQGPPQLVHRGKPPVSDGQSVQRHGIVGDREVKDSECRESRDPIAAISIMASAGASRSERGSGFAEAGRPSTAARPCPNTAIRIIRVAGQLGPSDRANRPRQTLANGGFNRKGVIGLKSAIDQGRAPAGFWAE
jgi:hypothetical protein